MKYNINQIKGLLKETLSTDRYNHSLNVMETSVVIAANNDFCPEKASVASLLHDCGKYSDKREILNEILAYKIIMDPDTKKSPGVWHSLLGSHIARHKYNIDDEDIINAIRYHTTGRACMSTLEKIVFIADAVEPGRNYDNINKIRKTAYENIDWAIKYYMENLIYNLEKKNIHIHKETLNCLEYLKNKTGGNFAGTKQSA